MQGCTCNVELGGDAVTEMYHPCPDVLRDQESNIAPKCVQDN